MTHQANNESDLKKAIEKMEAWMPYGTFQELYGISREEIDMVMKAARANRGA